MSDQPNMESPQSRLEAMLGDIQEEAIQEQPIEEPQEEEEVVEDAMEDSENEEEVVEDTNSEDDEPEAEDEVEEDSEEQTPEIIRLKVNGEEIEKPLDEVVALAQQGLDYTQKTQQVAEQKKELDALQEQLNVASRQYQEQQQLNNMLMDDVAKITALDQQLAQYANVDWKKMSDSDFVEAQKLFFDYNQLQQDRSNAVSQFEAKKQNLVSQQQQLVAQQVAKGKEQLSKEIENWSPETIRGIVETGKEYGFTEAELNSIVDTRQVRALHDAMQWRKLKSKNNSVTKKKVASAKPVVKPGSKDPKKAVNSNAKKMRDQLRKTGNQELASKLIENMI
jgi:hypothetical protein